jgi:hypothetical protein
VHKQAIADALSRGDHRWAVEFINRELDKLMKQREALKPVALPPFMRVAASWTGRTSVAGNVYQHAKMIDDPKTRDILPVWKGEPYITHASGQMLRAPNGQWLWQRAEGRAWALDVLSIDTLEELVKDVARELERDGYAESCALYEQALQALIDTLDDRISRA